MKIKRKVTLLKTYLTKRLKPTLYLTLQEQFLFEYIFILH